MSQTADSPKTYLLIFLALMGLTALTVAAAFINFGAFNTTIALVIAAIKASLVLWFFMHVRHADVLAKVFAFTGFYWLLLLIGLTLADYQTRKWQDFPHKYGWVAQDASHFIAKTSAEPEAHHS